MVTSVPSPIQSIPPAVQPVVSRTPVFASPPINLVDPIASKRLNLSSPFKDKILRVNGWKKLTSNLNSTFLVLPKTVWQGLRGDSAFTFSDFLHVAKIPYYLGGAVLAASFAAGRDRVNFARQAAGVALYYLGVMGAGRFVDTLYQRGYGIDLDLRFRKPNGDIEKVFASADFPRFDLLNDSDYRTMARKMDIPENIADPHREVQDESRRLIVASRVDKLILGNLLAAVGAGYLARSNGWARLLGFGGDLKNIWRGQNKGKLWDRVAHSGLSVWGKLKPVAREKLTGQVMDSQPLLRKSVWSVTAALLVAVTGHVMLAGRRNRSYESPLTNSLSPELAVGSATWEPVKKDLASTKVSEFSTFEQARADATLSGGGPKP
jgi:hypothetical protein